MTRMRDRRQLLAAPLLALIAGCMTVDSPAALIGDVGWPEFGGSKDSAQFSPLDQIDRGNVAGLQLAWKLEVPEELTAASPIVVGDRIYSVLGSDVVAIDVADGHVVWRAAGTASQTRGVVYWPGEGGERPRLLTSADNRLIALDAKTGQRITNFGDGGGVDLRQGLDRDPAAINRIQSGTPGRIFGRLIIVGSSPGEGYTAAPGDIRAYDVVTGKLAWTFRTIPAPGDFGAETWAKNPRPFVGGANAWGEMTLDEKNGIVFVPTGSATYDFYGADRAGNNLFADSLLALDARTGKRLWHFQTVHHDLWDYDNAQAPKLLTVKRDGKPIDIVLLAGKTGYIYTFERLTGQPFFPIVETPVPQTDVPGEASSPTQPIPSLPAPFARQSFTAADLSPLLSEAERAAYEDLMAKTRNDGMFTPPSLRGSMQMPGNHGGGQHGNGAIDPARGRFYVASVDQPAMLKLEKKRPPATRSVLAAAPEHVYADNCAACHGETAKGQGAVYPALLGIGKRMGLESFSTLLRTGRGQMPGFGTLPAAQTSALWDLLTRAADDPSLMLIQQASVTSSDAAPAGALPDVHSLDGADPHTGRRQTYFSGFNFLLSQNGLPAIAPPWSSLTAYDMRTGATLWRKPFGTSPEGEAAGLKETGSVIPKAALVATAGGLLFSATPDRILRAWDADTGEVLWSYRLPAQPQAIPAVYRWKGKQYILIASTYSGVSRLSMGLANSEQYANAYLAFALPQ